ncbi:hypothetical protein EXIGLDRAFT_372990 [Exidia glandulosa HHB12029]|uniref:Uncharacterized protein n=1 Tax=Exidia glandulosa HHB12029 TaxID=1314781 RepID=A0A165PXB2_EXIGL|nr:hypothetical protein EXIGLDRAFT_372990 [Exidia glandulosa HHB12029]
MSDVMSEYLLLFSTPRRRTHLVSAECWSHDSELAQQHPASKGCGMRGGYATILQEVRRTGLPASARTFRIRTRTIRVEMSVALPPTTLGADDVDGGGKGCEQALSSLSHNGTGTQLTLVVRGDRSIRPCKELETGDLCVRGIKLGCGVDKIQSVCLRSPRRKREVEALAGQGKYSLSTVMFQPNFAAPLSHVPCVRELSSEVERQCCTRTDAVVGRQLLQRSAALGCLKEEGRELFQSTSRVRPTGRNIQDCQPARSSPVLDCLRHMEIGVLNMCLATQPPSRHAAYSRAPVPSKKETLVIMTLTPSLPRM